MATPSVEGLSAFDLRFAERLHNWIARVTCSSAWEEDLFALFSHSVLIPKSRGETTIRVLHAKGYYPPGGSRSLMRRCSACRRWVPPQATGIVEHREEKRRYRVCYDCYCENRPISQINEEQAEHRPAWIVPNSEAKEYLRGMTVRRRSNRVLFRVDDPRVVGGHIDEDGFLHDPWVGSSPAGKPA